jgi:Protein of unknown function (DUF3108)
VIALGPVVALALSAAPACGLPPLQDAPRPFRPGEVLAYEFDVMGVVKAGTLSLAVEPPMSRGTLLPLRARVRNSSVFAKVRRVKGYALSWVRTQDLRPQRYRDATEEDGVRKTTDTPLDVRGPITMTWAFGERKGTSTLQPEREVMDLLSLVYYLRAAKLSTGQELCVDLVANRRFWRLRGAVAPESERVQSPAGTFDTLRIDAEVARADGSGAKRPVHLWFSKDERRLLVAAVSEIDLGPVRAMLSRAPPAAPSPSP